MSDRRVKVVYEVENSGLIKGTKEAVKATEELKKSSEDAGKAAQDRAKDIKVVADADQRAAKAAGLLYNAQGQLVDSNGKVLSSSQAAAHGVEAFSEAVYLAGHDSEVASAKAVAAAEKQKEAWATLGPVAAAAGAGIVAAVGLTVSKYASFDKAMSSVQAATHESAANMQSLREAAIGAGADTAFSAQEAAGGIEELAKAGVSTEDVLSGGLNGALSLAAAGNLDVATSAEFAASAMTQFQLSGKDIPHIADLLAAGAGKAQGSVNDMGLALSYAGVPAKAMGVSIEETTGAIALFASNGIIGEKAGTALRSMLVSMANPTDKTAKLMDELGISFEDNNGRFIGLAGAADVLKNSLADETEMSRNAALAQMFGNEALGAAQALYAGGADKVREWTGAVDDAGYAAETASIMQDNLAGDIEKLGGAFDTVFIQSGGAANDVLRMFVQTAEGLVDSIGRIPTPVLNTATAVAAFGGSALLAVGGVASLVPKVVETYEAFNVLRTSSSRSATAIRNVGKVAGTAAIAVGALAVASQVAGTGLDDLGNQSEFGDAIKKSTGDVDAARDALNEFSSAAGSGGAGISGIGQALEVLNMNGAMKAMDWVGSVGGIFDSDLKLAQEAITRFDGALSTLATSGDYESAASGFKIAADEGANAGLTLQQVADKFPEYIDVLRNAANGAASDQEILNWALTGTEPAALTAARGAEETATALEEVGVNASGAVESMEDFLDLLFQTGMITMNSRDAAFAYEEQLRSIDDAVDEIKKGELGNALNKAKDDFNETTKAGKLANDEFQALAKGGMDEVRAMSEEGLGQDELQEKLSTTYKDLVQAANDFGITGQAAKDLAREVMGVPEGVSVESWMSEFAKSTAEETTKSLSEIPGYTEVTVAVSEDGTVGEVQSKINGVTGKEEFVFVTEDGTARDVQLAILNIDGKTTKVWVTDDGTVVGTQDQINGIKGTNATVTVGAAGVGTVEEQLNWVARPRSSTVSIQKTITESVNRINNGPVTGQFGKSPGGYTGGLVGRLINGAAGGGLVPGQVPLNSQGDNILATVNGKPFGLRSGEMVVNEKATRENYSLLKAINDGLTIKLPGWAGGGTVGRAQSKVDKLQRQYSRMSTSQANRSHKLDLKDDLDAAKKELAAAKASAKAAEKQAKDAKKKADDARKEERERQGRLSEARFDLRRDLKRGEITDSFTSGSGMSVVDRLFEQSSNKDLSKGKRSSLRSTAYGMESQLLGLEKRSESLKSSLDKATEARDRLLEVSKSVASGLRGEYSLGNVIGNLLDKDYKGTLNAGSFVKSAQGKARQIRQFGEMLAKLRKKGYNEAIIQEIADLGTAEGTQVGNALLGASSSERKQLNNAYDAMDYWSGKAGVEVTRSMERGGIDAAEGLVRGLEGKTEDVEDAFYKLGKSAEKAFRKSLDMHSPSKTMAIGGVDSIDGVIVGAESKRQQLINTYVSLGDDVASAYQPALTYTVPSSVEVSRYAQSQAGSGVGRNFTDADIQALASAMSSVQLNARMSVGGRDFATATTSMKRGFTERR
ncbi:phage tail tape measure protein [Glutamicibacter halophytocola]|uniref:phage tail tape measure protein n=1 Tax=Glutamicibacter halophytocola TaxID=1933880 RepID=UPI0015C54768|nr:phage tail tape measure protein [Glutamicibacter halophytocola]NQD40508.1 phage tail tape measure protein [Glutamicibacter halophytocola]